MEIYLVRHGRAKQPGEDPERALTQAGVMQARGMARRAARAGVKVAEIWHSGKKRAEETAEIFGRELRPPRGVVRAMGLSPNDDVLPVAEVIEAGADPVMIVGHLPFLPRLASLLLSGDPERVGFRLSEVGIICLGRREGRWFLGWMATPGGMGENR